jgi:hypothetical protein
MIFTKAGEGGMGMPKNTLEATAVAPVGLNVIGSEA